MKPAEFFAICHQAFAPLMGPFDLAVAQKAARSGGVREWTLKNRTTGIRVIYEVKDHYVGVFVCRLVDGQIRSETGEMRPDTVLTCFDLGDLVAARLGGRSEEIAEELPLLKHPLPELLDRAVHHLREHGADVLRGDFTVFDALDAIVKRRAREIAFQRWGDRAVEFGWQREDTPMTAECADGGESEL